MGMDDGIAVRPDPGDAGDGADGAAPTGTSEGTARFRRAASLFVRWRDGDTLAMDDLVRLMTPVLWHVVRAYDLPRALAEDVVQTTWLALVRKHETIKEPAAVSGWLTVTARREAWRTVKAARRADPTEDEHLEPRLPAQRSAEHEADEADTARILWDAVHQLSERCRRLLRVIAFDDRPDYGRIARDTGMPVGSIGPTRGRCLAKLRAVLHQMGFTPEEVA